MTADSRLVTADAANDDDLFWACRGGGGGNFGIATAFDFATFPTTDVALFTLKWPWAAAPQVLAAWMAWIADAPDPLWSNCILAPGSPSPLLQVAGIWIGAQSEAAPYIDRLIANTGTRPSTRFLETIPLEHAMYVEAGCARLSESACHTTGQTAQAQLRRGASFASSSFIDRPLSDAGIGAVVAGIDERIEAHQPGAIAFDAYGGAINRVAAAATAFVHRNSLCCAQYSVSFNPADSPAAVAEHRAWLAGYGRALRPHVSESRVPELHRPDADRLARRVLRRQPGAPANHQAALGPRQRVPLRAEHPARVNVLLAAHDRVRRVVGRVTRPRSRTQAGVSRPGSCRHTRSLASPRRSANHKEFSCLSTHKPALSSTSSQQWARRPCRSRLPRRRAPVS